MLKAKATDINVSKRFQIESDIRMYSYNVIILLEILYTVVQTYEMSITAKKLQGNIGTTGKIYQIL